MHTKEDLQRLMDRYGTVDEIMEILGYEKSSAFYQWAKLHRISRIRIGGRTRYSITDIMNELTKGDK